MEKRILFLNGPNLNLLGERQKDVYGEVTLDDVEQRCRVLADDLGLTVRFEQTNYEGAMIELIHEARTYAHGIIINPGGYSHTSVAILDALNAFIGTVLEVHVSNIHKRQAFRHKSFVSLRADGVMAGFGTDGYELALRRMASVLL
ncbi:type II 3-dehydroquinate dehydratase [Cohaesibacter gelatinilyticus]|uniref:3-dehydroquinate dehydratase n=1 Tax=Cohaesibacter gelatinilyticus TaxID=372072 RepID=A0A285PJ23_9HYPH|nr:type II 3-dehydroquinate dehydratase [Cohaesibacter gelatinilyticus]SNZ21418.1 3-dehydroquinate dehydratase [Cohaesibacter gelatinilyticus]